MVVTLSFLHQFIRRWKNILLVSAVILAAILLALFTTGQRPEQRTETGTDIGTRKPQESFEVPSALPETEVVPQESTSFRAQSFSEFSNRFTVYQRVPTEASEAVGRELASRFGFSGAGELEISGVWLWARADALVRYNGNRRFFEYNALLSEVSGLSRLSQEELQQKAVEVLLSVGLYSSGETPSLSKVTYFRVVQNHAGETRSFSGADEIQFSFSPTFMGYPLVSKEGFLEPTQVRLDRFGRLVILNHYLQLDDYEEVGSFPKKSFRQVQQELYDGLGVVVKIEGGGLELPEVSQYDLQDVAVAYLLPGSLDTYIQPVYVLKGGGSLLSGRSVVVTVYLPAVEID